MKKIKFSSMYGQFGANFNRTNKVYGYCYYYCTNCNKQIDYYEHLKYDGKCELCYYC